MDWRFPIVCCRTGLPRRLRLASGMAVILALSACLHSVSGTEAHVHEQATQNVSAAVLPHLYSGPRIVSRLLDRHLNGDPNYADLLSIAVYGNNKGALKSLWEHGANPNDCGWDGVTGLEAAIHSGRASAILDMLRHAD